MFLAFDIGATKTRIAISENGTDLLEQVSFLTPQNFNEAMRLWKQQVAALVGSKKIVAAAGGFPAPLSRKKDIPLSCANLPDWSRKPLKKELQQLLGAKVFLENDTAMVGLGEATRGPGKGKEIVAYVTMSTGVGGCRFVNGTIDPSAFGFEPGHHIIDYKNHVVLESLIGGRAMSERYGTALEQLDDEEIWNNAMNILAIGIHNIMTFWSPDIVILGGSIARYRIDCEKLTAAVQEVFTIYPTLPEIAPATLGDNGGLFGALTYLQGKM